MSAMSRITIWLTSGEVFAYDFEPRGDGQWSTAGRIGSVLNAGFLRLRVGGSLVLFPIASILRAELTPVPADVNDPVAVPVPIE